MLLFLLSMILSIISFIVSSPLKSSFFLLLSLLVFILNVQLFVSFWFSYFLVFLFLSGVFVLLLYLSGLSWESGNTTSYFYSFLIFIISFFSLNLMYYGEGFLVTGFNINFLIFWIFLCFLILFLLLVISSAPVGCSLRKMN